MAFTRSWTIRPAGTVQAKQIDDEIRYLREDIEERMEQLLVDNWSIDPLVLKDSVSGRVFGKTITIPGVAFHKDGGNYNASNTGFDASSYTDSDPLIAPLELPVGCTIKLMEVLGNRGSAGSIQVRLHRHAFATVANTVLITTVAVGGAGAQLVESGVLAETIATNAYYTIDVDAPGTAGNIYYLYAVRITYDTPDVRFTR